jgi:quercetin dioxygenase-like cupin family protein
MFTLPDPDGYREVLDGIRLKTVAHGERTLMGEFLIDRGAIVPAHQHPQEQTGYLVSGRLAFDIDGNRFEAVPGTSWNIPGGVEHGAEALEESIVIEVFSPVREDYLG